MFLKELSNVKVEQINLSLTQILVLVMWIVNFITTFSISIKIIFLEGIAMPNWFEALTIILRQVLKWQENSSIRMTRKAPPVLPTTWNLSRRSFREEISWSPDDPNHGIHKAGRMSKEILEFSWKLLWHLMHENAKK